MTNSVSNHYLKFISEELELRKQASSYRELKNITVLDDIYVEFNGKKLINFSSNDYLSLSQSHQVKKECIDYINRFGAGSTASRLVCGNRNFFSETEELLAQLKKTEDALIFNSGYQLNSTIFSALSNKNTIILADRLCHNSLIQGGLLSKAKLFRYRHNDLAHLAKLLSKYSNQGKRIIIVTETVFSMDGDCCDLDLIINLARNNNALLFVDEAHATGVLGPQGMGLACGKDVDLIMGTFGKGCGVFGAYVACSKKIKEYLVNFCDGLIYTTALPPSVLGGIQAALKIVPTMEDERKLLQEMSDYLRLNLHKLGYSTGQSSTQIVPVLIGSDQKALELENILINSGYLGVCIRPPTVEKGQSRIRLALTSAHSKEHIDGLLHAINARR